MVSSDIQFSRYPAPGRLFDLSAYYNYSENLTITLEIINLTDEYERLFTTGDGTLDLMREYNHTGTQAFFGVRYYM